MEAATKSQLFERRTKSGRFASEISRTELEQYFHVPVDVAAEHMGLGLTKLKSVCRAFGIYRWPYRRVRRLQYLGHKISSGAGTAQDFHDTKQLIKELDLGVNSALWKQIHVEAEQLMVNVDRCEPLTPAEAMSNKARASPPVTPSTHPLLKRQGAEGHNTPSSQSAGSAATGNPVILDVHRYSCTAEAASLATARLHDVNGLPSSRSHFDCPATQASCSRAVGLTEDVSHYRVPPCANVLPSYASPHITAAAQSSQFGLESQKPPVLYPKNELAGDEGLNTVPNAASLQDFQQYLKMQTMLAGQKTPVKQEAPAPVYPTPFAHPQERFVKPDQRPLPVYAQPTPVMKYFLGNYIRSTVEKHHTNELLETIDMDEVLLPYNCNNSSGKTSFGLHEPLVEDMPYHNTGACVKAEPQFASSEDPQQTMQLLNSLTNHRWASDTDLPAGINSVPAGINDQGPGLWGHLTRKPSGWESQSNVEGILQQVLPKQSPSWYQKPLDRHMEAGHSRHFQDSSQRLNEHANPEVQNILQQLATNRSSDFLDQLQGPLEPQSGDQMNGILQHLAGLVQHPQTRANAPSPQPPAAIEPVEASGLDRFFGSSNWSATDRLGSGSAPTWHTAGGFPTGMPSQISDGDYSHGGVTEDGHNVSPEVLSALQFYQRQMGPARGQTTVHRSG